VLFDPKIGYTLKCTLRTIKGKLSINILLALSAFKNLEGSMVSAPPSTVKY
jgi:hypothetical protein